jgi:hypothetical protein
MNLLRSICCLFGSGCAGQEREATRKETPADLGQKEAELETTGKEQMSHMEGGTQHKRSKRGTE